MLVLSELTDEVRSLGGYFNSPNTQLLVPFSFFVQIGTQIWFIKVPIDQNEARNCLLEFKNRPFLVDKIFDYSVQYI